MSQLRQGKGTYDQKCIGIGYRESTRTCCCKRSGCRREYISSRRKITATHALQSCISRRGRPHEPAGHAHFPCGIVLLFHQLLCPLLSVVPSPTPALYPPAPCTRLRNAYFVTWSSIAGRRSMELLRTMYPTVSYPPADSKSCTKAGTNRLALRTVLTVAFSAVSHKPLASAASPISSVEGGSPSPLPPLLPPPAAVGVAPGLGDRLRPSCFVMVEIFTQEIDLLRKTGNGDKWRRIGVAPRKALSRELQRRAQYFSRKCCSCIKSGSIAVRACVS